jgi:hypothetical protein
MNRAQKIVTVVAAVVIAALLILCAFGISSYGVPVEDIHTSVSNALLEVGLFIAAVLVLGGALFAVLHKRKPMP